MPKKEHRKLKPIAGEVGYFGSFNSMARSALCHIESPYREITMEDGTVYRWWGEKSHWVPSGIKVIIFAWATPERTLRRVHVSFVDRDGMYKTVGMRQADKGLIDALFDAEGGKA